MKDLRIGEIIRGVQERDAIHMAVAPMEAGAPLKPGMRVGVRDGKAVAMQPFLGIVDPFLESPVLVGQRFWLFLFPGSITSLRHEWTHPDFAESRRPPDDPMALRVLESFAERIGESHDTTMDYLGQMATEGYIYGDTEYNEIPSEVWDAYECIAGVKVANRAKYFSCSC